jgi:hypothetical protein
MTSHASLLKVENLNIEKKHKSHEQRSTWYENMKKARDEFAMQSRRPRLLGRSTCETTLGINVQSVQSAHAVTSCG